MEQLIIALGLSALAGLTTTIGSFISFLIKKKNFCYLCLSMGFSAGVMIFVSFVELLGESIKNVGFFYAGSAFFIGAILFYVIDVVIPHTYKAEKANNNRLMRTGLFIALGIAIHNFPEGMAVAFSSLVNTKFAIPIVTAIALHNIPEGIAVAVPIFYASGSRKKAFLASFLSGLSEPLGALIMLLILYPFINEFILYSLLGAVAGVMTFISFDELLPYAYQHKNRHVILFGIFAGMLIMALSLYLL